MKILITGAAGFIGSNPALRLLERGDTVIGIDNHSDYYDPAIKEARLARHAKHPNYTPTCVSILPIAGPRKKLSPRTGRSAL
jgi:nucleoside-diphosphate-sugar epimerase